MLFHFGVTFFQPEFPFKYFNLIHPRQKYNENVLMLFDAIQHLGGKVTVIFIR